MGALSVHQRLPIPEQTGPHKAQFPPTVSAPEPRAVLTAPLGATSLPPSG